ncbi:MAG: EAL domain-containing protein, partial [Actinomycetota bacterium]|nr:EAL domain-containing protein [Actinomycetota bacterium]
MPPKSVDPLQFLTTATVAIVAGKGGVGKTTVTAVLARAAIRRGLRVLVIELDELKRSNETQGHSVGDEQLRLAGTVLREVLGGHHFAARITGDRLGALMIGVNDHEMGELERTTRQALAAAEVSAAIGVVRRRPETGLSGAMAAADEIIEQTHAVERVAVADAGHVAALMDAMDRGAIRAYFQPIVDLRTGEVVALEALARWQSADGVREPDQFLPQLQQAGLLGALFDRIL